MRHVLVFLLLVVLGGPADAKMTPHYDLAGLLLQSDGVVVAERVGPAKDPGGSTRYRIRRLLHGVGKVGDEVDVWDSQYDTRGRAIEQRVVLFLGTYDGKRQLVASGLRVIEHRKVFRFEQHDNPGPYRMVPQGNDPQDQWGNGGAQLELAGFEQALGAAAKRVAALRAAKTEPDPGKRRAAILALFVAGDAKATGFYSDRLAEEARLVLAQAGDLDGVLQVAMRDRSGFSRDRALTTQQLLAVAADPARSADLRAVALEMLRSRFDLHEDPAGLRAVIAMLADPAPAVREAAVAAVAAPASTMLSDRAAQRALDKLVAEARAAIDKLYKTETDTYVLAAILTAYERDFRKPAPARATGPLVVASLAIEGGSFHAEVRCLRPTRIRGSRIDAIPVRGPTINATPYNVSVHCGTNPSTGGGDPARRIPTGSYDLEVVVGTSPQTRIWVGMLVVATDGEMTLRR